MVKHPMSPEPKDLLVLVWVHGFKGNEVTFESFPDRVSHLLQATHPSLTVESHVFPAYQTRGELHAATLAFVDWLTELVVRLECDHGAGGGAGKAKIVLMGHSMGGLLIADAARDIVANTRADDPIWPKVVGIMAFDTPYLGLHPHVFKHQITQAASYYDTARSVASSIGMLSPVALGLGFGKFGNKTSEQANRAGPSRPSSSSASSSTSTSDKSKGNRNGKGKEMQSNSQASTQGQSQTTTSSKSSWSSWSLPSIPSPALNTTTMYGLGALALGAAAAGTAYYRREDFFNGWKYGYEHMTFVRNLWDDEGMKGRLEDLARLSEERNVRFWNFYTHLPPHPPTHLVSRTFTIIPSTTQSTYRRWRQASNTISKDEVSAHMGMFNPKTNDGFYDLGLAVVRGIGERIEEEGVRKVGEGGNGEFDVDMEEVDVEDADMEDKDVEEVVTSEKHGSARMEEEGWREEKDEKGRNVWVET